MEIYVLPRVHDRHPEPTSEDILTAFHSVMTDAQRDNDTWVCIGLDQHGRDVEMIYRQKGDMVLIYHAMTPPSRKTINEIKGLNGKRRNR